MGATARILVLAALTVTAACSTDLSSQLNDPAPLFAANSSLRDKAGVDIFNEAVDAYKICFDNARSAVRQPPGLWDGYAIYKNASTELRDCEKGDVEAVPVNLRRRTWSFIYKYDFISLDLNAAARDRAALDRLGGVVKVFNQKDGTSFSETQAILSADIKPEGGTLMLSNTSRALKSEIARFEYWTNR